MQLSKVSCSQWFARLRQWRVRAVDSAAIVTVEA
jgi:hypothetical protein